MNIAISNEAKGLIRLAAVELSGVQTRPSPPEFWRHAESIFGELKAEIGALPPSQLEGIQEVRAFYHATGLDPTKNRPSCEALLRRILQDKALYQINNVVDVLNLWSVKLLLPACVHDLAQVSGQVTVRRGRPGERYLGIGAKKDVNLENLLVLADERGPFGNPSADSDRTKVTLATSNVLLVLYIPLIRTIQWSEQALASACDDMARWCGATLQKKQLVE